MSLLYVIPSTLFVTTLASPLVHEESRRSAMVHYHKSITPRRHSTPRLPTDEMLIAKVRHGNIKSERAPRPHLNRRFFRFGVNLHASPRPTAKALTYERDGWCDAH